MTPPEARTRITLLLPAPLTPTQYTRIDQVLTELTQACGGVTFSSPNPSVFAGRWVNPSKEEPDGDDLVLILADAPVLPDAPSLAAYLSNLKLRCQRDFEQDLVWITVHRVDRITAHDPTPPG